MNRREARRSIEFAITPPEEGIPGHHTVASQDKNRNEKRMGEEFECPILNIDQKEIYSSMRACWLIGDAATSPWENPERRDLVGRLLSVLQSPIAPVSISWMSQRSNLCAVCTKGYNDKRPRDPGLTRLGP